jgi:hypothetical protein
MLTLPVRCRSVQAQRLVSRGSVLAAALVLLTMLPAGTVRAQGWIPGPYWIPDTPESAIWLGMHRIAVIQAAAGDVQGAKRTLSQIDEEGAGPSEVTGVWFCNGQAIYDHPPGAIGCRLCGGQGNGHSFDRNWPADRVPSKVPMGLPANYLAPNPRYGVLVNFTDEYDSHGTRVTSRRFADGHIVVETPRADGNSR